MSNRGYLILGARVNVPRWMGICKCGRTVLPVVPIAERVEATEEVIE